jgi:hypothetical protein
MAIDTDTLNRSRIVPVDTEQTLGTYRLPSASINRAFLVAVMIDSDEDVGIEIQVGPRRLDDEETIDWFTLDIVSGVGSNQAFRDTFEIASSFVRVNLIDTASTDSTAHFAVSAGR